MRILQLRFKNLNSLAGEWEIDLTHPAFAADGIFAITGPTGAGKSTILDAICLALYGRTPRLNRVTKSGNEIMSRQTGECFAEVTFETQSGRYRCHWGQHRARKKPDGELQPPKHEIADADSGEIFEAKIRGVAEQIETATGMDFDRFTRSMLLAQGGFAAFLEAPPDQRAPILEQITGTEIYSRISIRVHERRVDERNKLNVLQAELAGMHLLTAEEEAQLCTGLEEKSRQEEEIRLQVEKKNQAIAWLDGIARLEDELKQLDGQKADLKIRIDAFAPEQERLRLAHRALELGEDYAALTALRNAQETDQRALGECRASLPRLEDAARQAEGSLKAATEQLAAKKSEQQQAMPILRRVRELDLKIAEKNTAIQTANGAIEELSAALKALRGQQNRDGADLDSQRKALTELLQQLESTKADETLVENLAGIQGRIDALRHVHGQLTAKVDEIKGVDHQLQDASRGWQELSKTLDNEKRSLEDIRVSLGEDQAALRKILENREPADWRKRQSVLTEQKEMLARAIDAARSLSKSKASVESLGKRKDTLCADESSLTAQLNVQAEKLTALEKERDLLEAQLSLLERIENLENARHQLRDGEACPLCGATEHPFAAGNVPVPDETRDRLATVRSDLKSVRDTISDNRIKLNSVNKDLEQVAADRKEHDENIEHARRRINEIGSKMPSDLAFAASDPELEEKLGGHQENRQHELTHVTRTLEAVETAEKALNTLRESLEKARESVATAERDTLDAAHRKDSAGQLLERLKKEADGVREEQEKSLARLRKEVHVFGIETLSIENVDGVLDQLTARRDRWAARQKKKAESDRKIADLEMQTSQRAEQIKASENDLKKHREGLEGLLRERDAWVRERRDAFGEKAPDAEEARLAAAIDAADKALDAARRKSVGANQAFAQLKSRIDELAKAVAERDIPLKSSGDAFRMRLGESGFSDEGHYRAACLPESERTRLARQSQMLADENTGLTSKEGEKIRLLETERQKRITDESPDDLKHALAVLSTGLKERQEEIGGIRQKLKDNDALRRKQEERAQAIEAQQRECSRWDLLHELIGSADGKKYRNFAQGLTFEMMIGHANRQLQKITDRYLLIRGNAHPLELDVIDNYQAGEIRSTKNLSGGESFIVSLSLALGLSHMASQNVRVDSLFLDEGFGTLDDDTLETALETLAGLRQDGKLIGVISHVAALKERIPAQIHVNPQTGGRSGIEGPGCRRMD